MVRDIMQQNISRLAQKLINQRHTNLSEQSAPKIGLMIGVLVVITAAAYLPAVRAGFIWDDNDYVQDNQTLRSLDGLRQIWFKIGATPQYYPMVHTSYWLEYHLWKLNPAGYHIVNVLLHIVVAVLFWQILTVLGLPKPGAYLAAAIFALHPVHVESVAWITERKNVLSGVFYLGAALAYLRYALAPINGSDRNRSRRLYIISLVLFVCALLSKTVTCSLPAVLLLVLWWKRQRIGWADIRGLIPFFALGAAFSLLTAWMEKRHVGAMGEEWNLSFIERCLIAGRALCFYAGKLLWPSRLTFIYPRWNINAAVWQQYLYPAAAVSVVAAFWLFRRRIGKGPLVAVLIFAGTLVPALGFFNVYPMRYSFVADHFQYLASLSLITLVVCYRTAVRLRIWEKAVAAAVIIFVLGSLGVLTWRQCHIYKNPEALWHDTLQKNPECWMAHNNLATVLETEGKLDEAISHCREAVRLAPDNVETLCNLGTKLQSQGRLDEAVSYYRRAVQNINKYGGAYPYADAHCALGVAYSKLGRWQEAIEAFQQAIRVKPAFADAHYNLGVSYDRLGRHTEAIEAFQQAIRVKPDFADAHYNLGVSCDRLGRYTEAIEAYKQAIRIKPDYAEAHCALGITYGDLGLWQDAIEALKQAVRIKPDFAVAHNNLGLAYLSTGNTAFALEEYEILKTLDAELAKELFSLIYK